MNSSAWQVQSYRTCRKILYLSNTSTNAEVLEEVCRRLTDQDGGRRAVSYNAVKNMMATVRVDAHSRPITQSANPETSSPQPYTRPQSRDSSTARLASPDAFRLSNLNHGRD